MLPAWRTASTQRSSTLLDVTVVAMFMALSSPTRTSIGLASCSVQCGLAASERPSVLRLGSADFKKGSRLENHSSRKPSHPPVEIGSRMTDDIVRPARHPHQHVLRDKTSLRVDQPFTLPPRPTARKSDRYGKKLSGSEH